MNSVHFRSANAMRQTSKPCLELNSKQRNERFYLLTFVVVIVIVVVVIIIIVEGEGSSILQQFGFQCHSSGVNGWIIVVGSVGENRKCRKYVVAFCMSISQG